MIWPWRRKRRTRQNTAHPGNGTAARNTLAESARLIERDRQRVDSFTREIRQILGGRP